MISDQQVRSVSRRLRDLVEPLAANVYFATEAHAAYKELGLSFMPGYFCSRSACMGQVPGEIGGLTRILEGVPDETERATDLLRRAGEGAVPEGHALYSGLRSLDWPDD